MFNYKPLDIKDFSGGMTDEYVNGPINRGQYVTNFRMLNNKTLKTRFGSRVDSDVDPQIPAGTQRINTLINYNNDSILFAHSAKRIYYRNPVNFATVTSTASSDLFNNADAQTHLAHTQWNGHLIMTPENFDKPIKIYKDVGGIVRARTAGLPKLTPDPSIVSSSIVSGTITSADLPTSTIQKVGHGFTTGDAIVFSGPLPTPLAEAVTYYVIAVDADNFKVATSATNAGIGLNIVFISLRYNLTYLPPALNSWRPSVNDFFRPGHGFATGDAIQFTGLLPGPLTENVIYYVIAWNPDYFRVATSSANAFANILIDLDSFGTPPFFIYSVDIGGGMLPFDYAAASVEGAYVYGFFYSYEYTILDQTFIDFGPVTRVQLIGNFEEGGYSASITSIPTLMNVLGDHYDTANIRIHIYRTINGGQEFYKVTDLANGTSSYLDTLSDTLLQDNESIYTSGGVPDNDPPPLAKYCHSVNGFTYYAHIKEGSQIYPTLIRQSQGLDPDSVPASFNDQLEDEIKGLSSVQDIPIVGCRKHVYRIDGTFDELGRGGMSHRRLSDHAGLLSHESFVQAEGGLFWFGEDGIYYTEGFKCIKVTDHLNDRYDQFKLTLKDKTRKIKGIYYPEERSIYWTVSQNSKVTGQEECDSIWVLDLTSGISEEMPCHLWEGTTFSPTSLAVFNGFLTRGESTGYILIFKESYLTDPKIIAGQATNTWPENTIIWNLRSITSNFGSGFTRKTANKLLLDMLSSTTVSIQMTAINDEGRLQRPFTPIRWRKGFVWGDDDFVWGDPNFVWYYGGILSIDRRFPAKGLRFNYLQIDLTNAFTNIVNSDLLGTATVDATLDTITTSAPTVYWPAQAVDYFIYLEQDNFAKGYKILFRTDNVLTVDDSAVPTLVDGVQRWQIKGYKKGEIINIVGFSISWADTSRSFDTYNTGDNGALT